MRITNIPAQSGPPPAAMTFAEFLKWSRIGKTKAYAEAKAGRLKIRKLGGKTLVLLSDAEKWLNELPLASAS